MGTVMMNDEESHWDKAARPDSQHPMNRNQENDELGSREKTNAVTMAFKHTRGRATSIWYQSLMPAHQGMKSWSCGLVRRIGTGDSATPHPDPSGGQAPALH